MNNIIIYGSHYGTTERYAEELSKKKQILNQYHLKKLPTLTITTR